MSEIEFVDDLPPAMSGRGGRRHLPDLLAPLTEHPGKWARVGSHEKSSGASSMAQQIRHGRSRWLAQWKWEAAQRAEDGAFVVYVRCIGPA